MRTTRTECIWIMKKTLLLLVAALSLTLSACDDGDNGNKETESEELKSLGNGFYSAKGHRFVDLALPSGLLWAETNIGATVAADAGNYFAWGETSSRSSYAWADYKYGNGTAALTKYTADDGITTLDMQDDAARVAWGKACRMPSKAEIAELLDEANCTWTWTGKTDSNANFAYGYVVKSTRNGNEIFIPAAGYYNGSTLYSLNTDGGVWSSTLSASGFDSAYTLSFLNGHYETDTNLRHLGVPVRAVAELSE